MSADPPYSLEDPHGEYASWIETQTDTLVVFRMKRMLTFLVQNPHAVLPTDIGASIEAKDEFPVASPMGTNDFVTHEYVDDARLVVIHRIESVDDLWGAT